MFDLPAAQGTLKSLLQYHKLNDDVMIWKKKKTHKDYQKQKLIEGNQKFKIFCTLDTHCISNIKYSLYHANFEFREAVKDIYVGVTIYIMEKAMAPHSSTLAWKIPRTEEPGRLQSMGSLGVGHD